MSPQYLAIEASTPRACICAPSANTAASTRKRQPRCRASAISAAPIGRAEGVGDAALRHVALVEAVVVDAGEPGHVVGEHQRHGGAQILPDLDGAGQGLVVLGDEALL